MHSKLEQIQRGQNFNCRLCPFSTRPFLFSYHQLPHMNKYMVKHAPIRRCCGLWFQDFYFCLALNYGYNLETKEPHQPCLHVYYKWWDILKNFSCNNYCDAILKITHRMLQSSKKKKVQKLRIVFNPTEKIKAHKIQGKYSKYRGHMYDCMILYGCIQCVRLFKSMIDDKNR